MRSACCRMLVYIIGFLFRFDGDDDDGDKNYMCLPTNPHNAPAKWFAFEVDDRR